jgi:hypothetical protein
LGLSRALQPQHSWKNTHASVGMRSLARNPHSGQVITLSSTTAFVIG